MRVGSVNPVSAMSAPGAAARASPQHSLFIAEANRGGSELLDTLLDAIADPTCWPFVLSNLQASLSGTRSPASIRDCNRSNGEQQNSCTRCASAMNGLRSLAATASTDGEEKVHVVWRQVQKAAVLCSRIRWLEMQRAMSLRALDRLDRGLLFMDKDSKIVGANSVAWDILKQADGLCLAFDGVHAARPQETSLLRETIKKAAGASARHEHFDTGLTVSRSSLRRALSLVIASVAPETAGCPEKREVATMFVCDPERKLHVDPGTLSRLYGLTKSEANLCLKLLDGESLETAADQLCISVETARTHVKRIFLKTGTNRQPQLVAMILNSRL